VFLTTFAFSDFFIHGNEMLTCSFTEVVSDWALGYLECGAVTLCYWLVSFYCLIL